MERGWGYTYGMKAITSSLIVAVAAGSIAQMDMGSSRYGGPVYSGPPKLEITARVLKNGGGAKFSVAKGVVAIVGEKQAKAAFAKLAKQYGKERTARFVQIFDFAVSDAAKLAAAANVKLPPASKETGRKLAATLVKLGVAPDHVFYTEYFLDHLLGHKLHMTVMNDIDAKFGQEADMDYHRIANQAYYDLARLLGMKDVKLAKLH